MKFKLTNYDSSAYKQFETLLNDLSSKGYNCTSVDLFTVFKKDNQKFYYKTDIFVPKKNTNQNNREQRDQWLLNYVNHGYEFIGKSRKIYVFKASKNIKIKETNKQLLLTYFKRNRTILNIIYIFIAIMLSFLLIPNVLVNRNPANFITNGAIILHYVPVLFCSSLLFKFFYNYYTTEKIKDNLNNNTKNPSNQYLFNLSNWLLILSVLFMIFGFTNDFLTRKEKSITDNILTLSAIDLPSSDNNTYTKSSSFLIDETISYQEKNNDNILIVNYYKYNNKNKARKGLDNYLNAINFKYKKQIANGYLLSNDSIYNCIAFVKDKQLIVVETSLDLVANDTYKKIIAFNY